MELSADPTAALPVDFAAYVAQRVGLASAQATTSVPTLDGVAIADLVLERLILGGGLIIDLVGRSLGRSVNELARMRDPPQACSLFSVCPSPRVSLGTAPEDAHVHWVGMARCAVPAPHQPSPVRSTEAKAAAP